MSTQTQGVRGPLLRGYRMRKTMVDLNFPPTENRDQEGSSTQYAPQRAQATQQQQPVQPTTIDIDIVEAFDDDVIESSPRAFAQAKSNAKRNQAQRITRGSPVIVDVDSGLIETALKQRNGGWDQWM